MARANLGRRFARDDRPAQGPGVLLDNQGSGQINGTFDGLPKERSSARSGSPVTGRRQ